MRSLFITPRKAPNSKCYRYLLSWTKSGTRPPVKEPSHMQTQYNSKSKAGGCWRGRPGGSLFNNYDTEVKEELLLLSLECSPLPLMFTL